jgi:hypothetical protein
VPGEKRRAGVAPAAVVKPSYRCDLTVTEPGYLCRVHRRHPDPEVSVQARSALALVPLALGLVLDGCTGLVAGPEVAATTAVPASRDSAYVRARRGLTAESFTMDVVDSTHGRLTGTRYPSSNAQLGTGAKCRVVLAMDVGGGADQGQVSTTTRWVAPEQMANKAPEVCEQERQDVLQRLADVLAPPPPP